LIKFQTWQLKEVSCTRVKQLTPNGEQSKDNPQHLTIGHPAKWDVWYLCARTQVYTQWLQEHCLILRAQLADLRESIQIKVRSNYR